MATIEESLKATVQKAIQMSRQYPNRQFRVMDKNGQWALIVGSDLVYRLRLLEGWGVIGIYQNGKPIG